MKDETNYLPIKEVVDQSQKYIRSWKMLVENIKKQKVRKKCCCNNHNGYKDVLLNNKCLRLSMNRIQSKNHRTELYRISKSSVSCFDEKIYIKTMDMMD